MDQSDTQLPGGLAAQLRGRLGDRLVVVVGMMGSGKSVIGRRLAARMRAPFLDSDDEIEAAHGGMTIPEIFETYGEEYFRAGEEKVIRRLFRDNRGSVLALGGGSFANEAVREMSRSGGVSVWLNAEVDLMVQRIASGASRPMLKDGDTAETVRRLLAAREPFYRQADVTIMSGPGDHEKLVDECVEGLCSHLEPQTEEVSAPGP